MSEPEQFTPKTDSPWAWDPHLEEWYHIYREPTRHLRLYASANALSHKEFLEHLERYNEET